MTFWETVVRETLKLLDNLKGDLFLNTALLHAFPQIFQKSLEMIGGTLKAHHFTQSIRLGRCESRHCDRDLHALFLEERNSESPFEDRL